MKFFQIIFLFFVFSCANDFSEYGKVKPYDSSLGKDQRFIFTIEENYVRAHRSSKQDEKNPIMTKAETDLLEKILRYQNFCINEEKRPAYVITSKQEKIYDVTFASLIEQNYNARPAAPRAYYGQCQ